MVNQVAVEGFLLPTPSSCAKKLSSPAVHQLAVLLVPIGRFPDEQIRAECSDGHVELFKVIKVDTNTAA